MRTGCTPDAFSATIGLSLLNAIRPTIEFTRFPLFVELFNCRGLLCVDVKQRLGPAQKGRKVSVQSANISGAH
jgi:hypothetical protein